jgi:ATP-dependent Clp protease ATP-binding subunit ClpA
MKARSTTSQALARVLNRSEQEAKDLKDDYISVEHLLLALWLKVKTTCAAF